MANQDFSEAQDRFYSAPTRPSFTRGYETAGMGSDTDPGVTGGYGDTGFGAIGNEPPEPVTEEPDDTSNTSE